jgi:hypothetical protein
MTLEELVKAKREEILKVCAGYGAAPATCVSSDR